MFCTIIYVNTSMNLYRVFSYYMKGALGMSVTLEQYTKLNNEAIALSSTLKSAWIYDNLSRHLMYIIIKIKLDMYLKTTEDIFNNQCVQCVANNCTELSKFKNNLTEMYDLVTKLTIDRLFLSMYYKKNIERMEDLIETLWIATDNEIADNIGKLGDIIAVKNVC